MAVNCAINVKSLILDNPAPSPVPPNQDLMRNLSSMFSWITTGSGLARKSPLFRPLFDAKNNEVKMRNLLMSDHEELMAKLAKLDPEVKTRLSAVMEYLRLSRTDVTDTGRRLVIRTKALEDPLPNGGTREVKPALSQPGDTLSLSRQETDLFFEIKDWLDNRYTVLAQSILATLGYDGAYDQAEIEALPDDDKMKGKLLELYKALESQRVVSYIPFMRSGDVRVTVLGPDGKIENGAFYLLDSNAAVKNIVGKRVGERVPEAELNRQLAEINRLYPESEGYKVTVSRLRGDVDERLRIEDLSMLDKLLNLMDARSGDLVKRYFNETLAGLVDPKTLPKNMQQYGEQIAKGFIKTLPDNVRSILIKDIITGIMKQSRNIAGYDPNLVDKLLDYNRIIASSVSHRTYRPQVSAAYEELQKRAEKPERDYTDSWMAYIDTPESVMWRGMRAFGFFSSMWGSFASSMVNAMSVWTVTAPQLAVLKGSAPADVYRMSVQIMKGARGTLERGFFLDPRKVPGLTPDERAALVQAHRRGTVAAQLNPEVMGVEATLMPHRASGIGRMFSTWLQVGASVVTITEELSKVSAFIVAYRLAKDPAVIAQFKETYANNERAKAVIARGSQPFEVAEFMVETTTFIGGQIEKPPVLRNAGGVILQFSQWPLQLSKLLYANFVKQGARGRVAGTFTILSMWVVAGALYGLPFGDDAINIYEWLAQKISGEKLDFRNDTQRMLAEILDNRGAAEAIMYGPMRALLGINASQRVGFSSFLPEMGDPFTAIPALAGSFGKIGEFNDRMKSGQPVAAYTALLSPTMGKGTSDLMKAVLQYPSEGYQSRFGRVVKAPEDITAGDMLARALGFQSADIARKMQANRAADEVKTGTLDAERNLKVRLAKKLAAAIKAEEAGDADRAARLRDDFEAEMDAAVAEFQKDIDTERMAYAVRPPSGAALREAIIEQLYPEMAVEDAPKLKRPEMIDIQNDLMGSDEEDIFYEP